MLDVRRHINHFDAQKANYRVDVIGAGAVGSKIAMELAKLGLRDIHIWDNDIVESHNIPNQLFYMDDIGKSKVDAVKDHVKRATGLEITTHKQFIDKHEALGNVVFLCVDTMIDRKNIFETCLRNNFVTKQVIETRMGAEQVRVYGFNPMSRDENIAWANTLCDDDKTEESVCGSKLSVGPTASINASLAVTRYMQWHNSENNRELEKPHFQQVLLTRPLTALTM